MSPALGVPLNPPYLLGAALAVNATRDLHLLIDSPGCITSKAQLIHGRHDLRSTLLACDGYHRVQYSGVTADTVASDPEPRLERAMRRILAWPSCGALLVGAMPMCAITGTDYERLVRAVRGPKPCLVLPNRSLDQDWLAGYAAVLQVLAETIDLNGGVPGPDKVAVVGYLMDRNEGDHLGNLAELRGLLEGLGLDAVSIWPAGQSYEQLREARHASTILSLPHGRQAARALARRLEARLVEVDLPFGLEGTRRWVEGLGTVLGREERASRLIRTGLAAAVPPLEWVVPHVFVGRRLAFAGDPHYAVPFLRLVEEVGAELCAMFLTGDAAHLSPSERALLETTEVHYAPMQQQLRSDWARIEASGVDLLVANTQALELMAPKAPWIEWGYPSEYAHALSDEPFLGFKGALAFLGRMSNEMLRRQSALTLGT